MSYHRSNYSRRSNKGPAVVDSYRKNIRGNSHVQFAREPRDCGLPTMSVFYGVIHCETGRYTQYADRINAAKVKASINKNAGKDIAIGFARGPDFFICL